MIKRLMIIIVGVTMCLDLAHAQNPFQKTLMMNPVKWEDLNFNREAIELSKKELRERGVAHPYMGFAWRKGDDEDENWYPQGITGLRKAGKKYLLVSWYDKNKRKGVRVSLVDVTNPEDIRYRHILLVEPSQKKGFRPINIHAGGLATRKNVIYVADTNYGIRVFDINFIFEADTDTAFKKRSGVIGGKAYAFGYKYILPQIMTYKLDGPKFSFASFTWSPNWTNSEPPQLLTGNYHNSRDSKYDNPPATLVLWDVKNFDITGKAWDSRDDKAVALPERMQGAVLHNQTLWLSTSGEKAYLRVATYPFKSYKKYPWPHGTEDLHYSPNSGNLWGHTEHPKERIVFAVKLNDYQP